ncbi:hypothetical protein EYZ11_013531 [Aspergillus tanneri]|uniref:Uncharacterized protein n=1 Tax=Aspergillus tanneri TaxID=1220188 RepID=A0A4V3UMF1_9EURO|nr:hypothetical protein EYZ11_013531 [Aspergillus tanneri]
MTAECMLLKRLIIVSCAQEATPGINIEKIESSG